MNRSLFIIAGMLLFTATAQAAVADSSPGGFTIKIVVNAQGAPADVYRKFVHDIGNWWEPIHTYSHDAHNLSIDDKPMGCWCEKLPDGGGVQHMETIFAMPGKLIRFSGAIGPMQAMAAVGSMSVEFKPVEGGTAVELTYALGGYSPQGFDKIAPIIDMVLTTQITRFKNYVDHGNPAPPAK